MTEDETLRFDLLKYAGGDIKRADEYYAWIKQAPPIVTPPSEPVADGLTLEEGGDVSGRGWVDPPLDPMTMEREEFFEEPGEHEQAGLPREDFYHDPPPDEQCQTEPVLSADYHDEASASSPPSEEDVRSEPPASDEGSGGQIAIPDGFIRWVGGDDLAQCGLNYETYVEIVQRDGLRQKTLVGHTPHWWWDASLPAFPAFDIVAYRIISEPARYETSGFAHVVEAEPDKPLDLAALTRAAQERLDAKEALEELTTEGWVGVRIFDWSTVRGTDIIEARYEDGFCERLSFWDGEWIGTRLLKPTHIRAYVTRPDLNADDEIDLLADEELEPV